MAREYGKNWFSMWIDEHFCTGRLFDKLFYQVLLGDNALAFNAAGIMPLNFRKWRKALRDGPRMPTELDVKASLVRQERRRYVFTDEDTGELLIRSMIRRDEVWKQPNMMLSALRAAGAVQSGKLAVVLLAELDRITLPEVKGDSDTANRLRASLTQENTKTRTHLETLREGFAEPLPEPFAEDFPEGLPEPFAEGFRRPGEIEPFGEPFGEGFREPPVVVAVGTTPTTVDNHLGRARTHEANGSAAAPQDPDEPPPKICRRHPQGPDHDRPCRTCQAIREAREAEAQQQQALAAQTRQAFWVEVEACDDCDDNGYVDAEAGRVRRCPAHDWRLIRG
jgi:hypothetical protein